MLSPPLFFFLDPVILDPNTTTSKLEVSPDLTSVLCLIPSLLNSTATTCLSYILGSEGFSSGVHTWQVDVEACDHWVLGVVTESAKRLKKISSSNFLIYYINGKCSWTPVALKIKKVCIFLDMVKKQVVFSDPDTNVTMKSCSCEFTEKIYPCFLPIGKSPVKILPSV